MLAGCTPFVEGTTTAIAQSSPAPYWAWAPTPPMGWNSYDCFGSSVTESQVKAHADYMSANLKQFGYEYVVVDIRWYDPDATGYGLPQNENLTMDQYGRLLPAPNRFPSSINGAGFKPLADYIHGKGLKFGIHMMRGIPRLACGQNTPVLGTTFHAPEIADFSSMCRWDDDMYGVDVTRAGAQAYYNSVANLWASWGVDFVKVDDLSSDPGVSPYPYHAGEIEAIRAALDQCGRPIVLSTSPGPTPLGQGPHISRNANMWRIDDDMWDSWPAVLRQFGPLQDWGTYRGSGHFPDADMLPLGKIGAGNADPNGGRDSMLTPDEQRTLMTLWCIARSPLMYGGDLTRMDAATLALISNPEVLGVDQNSYGNRQLFNHTGLYAWIANVPSSTDKYLAVFNTRDAVSGDTGTTITVNLADVGLTGQCHIRDLWQRADVGNFTGQFSPHINWHGAGLFRISGGHNAQPPNTLAATPGNHSVALSWDAVTGAVSYDVFRANSSGGPYVMVANGVTDTTYVDQGLPNGSRSFYVIASETDVGPSGFSTEVSAIPVGAPTTDWTSLDLGYPGIAGDAGFADGLYTIRAGGDDIWNQVDSFRFHWQHMSGDGTLIARVRSLQPTDPDWTKAGVMFREDGTLGAPYSFMFITPDQVSFQYRATPAGYANLVSVNSANTQLHWVKLIRKTNTFYGYHSSDGVNWISSGNVTVSMAANVLAGLAVTAHNNALSTTAVFDLVAFVPQTAVPADGTLRVLQWLRSSSDGLLVIPSVAGQTYQLQKTSDLAANGWQNVGAPQSGTGDLLTFVDLGGGTGARQFYRVVTLPAMNATGISRNGTPQARGTKLNRVDLR